MSEYIQIFDKVKKDIREKAATDFVTLTDSQTLTNKGLTAPSLTSPTITGALFSAPGRLGLKTGTAVNAVAAARVLTVGGVPTAGHKVTVGTQDYTWVSAISVAAVKATGALTFTGNAQNSETFVVGSKTYTWKTALSEAAATSTVTLTGNMTDGNRLVVGSTVYTFRDSLSDPAVPFEVKIGASASDTLDNYIAATMAAAGAGSTYSTGTTAHPDVTAAAGDGDTAVLTAKVKGTAANSIATLEYSAVASWTNTTLQGGVNAVANEIKVGGSAELSIDAAVAAITGAAGAGTTYSTGTAASTQVTATKRDATHLDIEALTAGTAANAFATTETMANASWGGLVMSGGVDAVAEAPYTVVLGENAETCIDRLVAAGNKAAGEGTTYGTGTVAHPSVTFAKSTASTMTITAKVKGEAANTIATTEDDSNTSWAGATMAGGVNGTVGAQWDTLVDADYLYVAVAANTVADTNWRRVALGSAY